MISVTGAQQYLRGDLDHATLAVPERSIGAIVVVNQVLQRIDRLVRGMDDRDRRANGDRLREQASRSRRLRDMPRARTDELDEHHDGASGHAGGRGHLMQGVRQARSALGRVGRAASSLGRVAGRATAGIGGMVVGEGAAGAGLVGGLLVAGVAGSAIGGYMTYRQARDTGRVGIGTAAGTGASVGGTIGTMVAPGIGTAIGAAIGAGVGAAGSVVYNNRENISRLWTRAAHGLERRTHDAVASAHALWDASTARFHRVTSVVGDTLHRAWTGATDSVSQYGGRVNEWVRDQSKNVTSWLDGIVQQLLGSVSNFSLRQVATEFLDRIKSMLAGLVPGFGGGKGGGGDSPAPLAPSGFEQGTTAPSGRGRGPSYVPRTGETQGGARAPARELYAPNTTQSPSSAPRDLPTIGARTADPRTRTDGITGYGTGTNSMGFDLGGPVMPQRPKENRTLSPVASSVPTMYQMGGVGGNATLPAMTQGTPNVVEKQAEVAAKRKLPIQEELRQQLQFAAEKTGLQVEISSGGQDVSGPNRTGSHRHDLGGAADLKLIDVDARGNRRVLSMQNPEDAVRMREFTQQSVRAGATGVGAGEGYMGPHMIHIGGGSVASWGGAPWIRDSLVGGRADAKSGREEFEHWKAERSRRPDEDARHDSIRVDEKPVNVFEGADPNRRSFVPRKSDITEQPLDEKPDAIPSASRDADPQTRGALSSSTADATADAQRARDVVRRRVVYGIQDATADVERRAESDDFRARPGAAYRSRDGRQYSNREHDDYVRASDDEARAWHAENGLRRGDLKASWTPEHEASPRATTVEESRGNDDAPAPRRAESSTPAGGGDSSQQSHRGHASIHDIPTVHPNVHLAVSGNSDKYA